MSEQALDLRRSLHVAWRHKIIVGIVAALGFLLGAGYASIHPSMLTAKTLVVLPQNTPNMATAGYDAHHAAQYRSGQERDLHGPLVHREGADLGLGRGDRQRRRR
jgi:LPS O-antigen subunit length determinant protein (WzzB/FepE family)